jgi:hypothetical protein
MKTTAVTARTSHRSTTYAALCPLRLNVSLKQDEFLRTMASQQGIGKAEFLRRIIQDAMQSGRYVPSTPEPGRQESRAVPREHNSHI